MYVCMFVQVAKWEEKGGYLESGRAEDVEARKLKHLTTKPCPKCGVRIEKSGGCPVRFVYLREIFNLFQKMLVFHILNCFLFLFLHIAHDLCAAFL